jgi:hypothetical protein
MTTKLTHIRTAALALSLAVALPALADSYKEPVSTSTRETTTQQDANGMTTTTTTTTKHHYVYYADHDIYFAPETKTYYWQASAGDWKSGTVLPEEDRAYVRGKGVTIELDTDKPYTRHDYVIAHYKVSHHDDD